MTSKIVSLGAFALFCLPAAVALSGAVTAHETGLASIHDWRREGSRVCMTDHFHSGSGNGATRGAAQREAIASWADFTIFEYGDAWGSFQKAASKSVKCNESAGKWRCDVEARPCKDFRAVKAGSR
jgi:hypothetical protein